MIRGLFEGPQLIIILLIILVIFGGSKLPGLAKGLGQSIKIFRSEVKTPEDEAKAKAKAEAAAATPGETYVSQDETRPAPDPQANPKP